MRSRMYAYGVRQKRNGTRKKVVVFSLFSLLVLGFATYVVPRTSTYETARQLYAAAFGRSAQVAGLELSQAKQTEPAEIIADTQKPVVQIISPSNNQGLTGDAKVQIQASDNTRVVKLEFYIDGSLVGSDETEPFEYNWATSGETNARHTLHAKAYDAAGNVEQAQAMYTTVNKPKDSNAPTVSLTAPGNGSLVKGVTTLRATAYDQSGVRKVEFYVGTSLVGSDEAKPFALEWDASRFSGVQKLTARAYDSTGNINTSGITTVLVDAGPADTIKPDVSLSQNGIATNVTGTVVFSAMATDDTGVVKVEFYRDNTLLSTDLKAPYSYAWDTLSVENGAYLFTAKAYDASGNMQVSRALSITVTNPKDRTPPRSFSVPNIDSPNQQSAVTLYGACSDKLTSKASAAPTSLGDYQAIVGYEFSAACAAGSKNLTVSVDLGREILNRGALKVLKVRGDGTVADITLSSTVDTRRSNGVMHTFVTYGLVDGGENDQDGAQNGSVVDLLYVVEEIKLKDIEQPIEQKSIEPQASAPSRPAQLESVRLVDAINIRAYVPFGAVALVLGFVLFLVRPRRSYTLHK